MNVDCEDLLTTRNLRRHDCAQAYCTAAVDCNGGTESGLQSVEHGTGTRLDAAAEWTEQGQVYLLVDLYHVARMRHHMGAKGGLAEERTQFSIPLMQTAGAILHPPAKVQVVEA